MSDITIEIDEYDNTPPDDCIQEIAEIAPELTAQERIYVYWRSIALPPGAAFKKAGYVGSNWRIVETRPKVRNALQDINEKQTPDYRITQAKVIGIIMEGIDIARRKDQAKTIIEGAVALAGIAGVGAATKIQVDGKHQHLHALGHQEPKALQNLPRTSLEAIVGANRALPNPQVLEAEFEEVKQQY